MMTKINSLKKTAGFALAYVLFMVAILFLLGYTMIMTMRQEADSSFRYLDASIAHFVAETGIEHALYVLKWHKYSDKIPMLNAVSTLDINKKFGSFQAFDNYALPKNNPDDSWAPSAELKNANIETEIQKLIPEAKINSIKLKFDPQKNMGDDNLTFGVMTITCQGEYRGVKRTVSVQKQIELYRDMSVMTDYAFAVNNPAEETVPARRKNNAWFSTNGIVPLPNLTQAANFVPQDLVINNGVAWNADDRTPAKVFARNIIVELNESRYPSSIAMFTSLVIPGAAGLAYSNFAKAFSETSMLIKFHSKKVDRGVEASPSLFKEHVQHSVGAASLLGTTSIMNLLDPSYYSLCESDFPTGWDGIKEDLAKTVSAVAGGSRGSIDFTGHFPTAEDWFSNFAGFLKKGFNSLFGIPEDKETVHNMVFGNIQRKFGNLENRFDGILGAAASLISMIPGVGKVVKNLTIKRDVIKEQYDFDSSFSNVVPPGIPPSVAPGKLPYVYPKEVYQLIAKRHNTEISELDAASVDTLKYKNGDVRFFDANTNKKFFEDKTFKADAVWGLLKNEKTFKNVVWRPFWGWADSSDQCAKEFPWYTFSTSKTIFEAAGAESRLAMKVDGIYFVDGDVLVEGFYKGRGAIVATGNIIIGGQIMRHPDDGVFDAGCERNYEFLRGCNNCLQLVALGTNTNSQAYPGVTGKIIFAPHAYDNRAFSGAFGSFQAYWSERPYIRIDANLYGEKGMLLDVDCVKDGFKFFGGNQDTFMTIFGNYTCQELNWKEDDEKNCYPDKTIINKFQKWVDIFEDIKTQKWCTINFGKSSDRFVQQGE